MDSGPSERGIPSSEETIFLDRSFLPFDPRFVVWSEDGFETNLILSTKTLPPFPLQARALLLHSPKLASVIEPPKSTSLSGITPFDPEVGYQITKEDTNPQARKEKVKLLRQQGGKDISDKVQLWLSFFTSAEELEKAGIVTRLMRDWDREQVPYFVAKNSDYYNFLKSLRLNLSFPTGVVCESRPEAFGAKNEIIHIEFMNFYPLDTGPLPSLGIFEGVMPPVFEGFEVLLPNDLEKLKQIEARVYTAEQ